MIIINVFHKVKNTKSLNIILLIIICIGLFIFFGIHSVSAHPTAYDISQYQGYISNHQAKKLKHEVSFVILRAQGAGADARIHHNIHVMNHNHIPYGVYSYSYYTGIHSANREARNLYHLAPHAKFFVNDCEENDAGNRLNHATQSWSKTLHHYTHRPIVLYSGLYFLTTHFTHHTLKKYNAIWLAAYASKRPRTNFHYDLWQFTDNHYSHALKESLDANIIPKHGKPVSFWIGHYHNHINKIKKISANSADQLTNSNHYTYVRKSYYKHGHHFTVKKHHILRIHDLQTNSIIHLHHGHTIDAERFVTKSNHTTYGIGYYHNNLITFSGNKSNLKHI